MKYEVFVEKVAQRSLARVPQLHQDRMLEAIADLANKPRPAGSKKLGGRTAWRIRVDDYRVIYEVDDDHHTILGVLRVERAFSVGQTFLSVISEQAEQAGLFALLQQGDWTR